MGSGLSLRQVQDTSLQWWGACILCKGLGFRICVRAIYSVMETLINDTSGLCDVL